MILCHKNNCFFLNITLYGYNSKIIELPCPNYRFASLNARGFNRRYVRA